MVIMTSKNKVLNEDLHKFKDQGGHFAKPVAMAGCKDYNFCPGMQISIGVYKVFQICKLLSSI